MPSWNDPSKIFATQMQTETNLLELEARAGVPLGAFLPGTTEEDKDLRHHNLTSIGDGRKGAQRRRFTRNSEHFTRRIMELVEVHGLRDPIQVLMEIATGKEVTITRDNNNNEVTRLDDFKKTPDHKTRVMAAAELASYLYPKRKSVEVSGAEGNPIAFSVSADNTPLPTMPTDAELEQMQKERRQQAADAEKTINGRL